MRPNRKLLAGFVAWAVAHPGKAFAGFMTLLGAGGAASIPSFTTPSIVPQASSYFNTNAPNGSTNIALKTNNGTLGPFELPSTITNSHSLYIEGTIDQALTYFVGGEYALSKTAGGTGIEVSSNSVGQPAFLVQNSAGGAFPGSQWWNAISTNTDTVSPPTSVHGSGYWDGLYPFTMPSGNCARPPSGAWNGGGAPVTIDPGFLCGIPPGSLDASLIPLSGARQATSSTTCVSSSPVSGEMKVTTTVGVAHGIAPGQSFTTQGFTPAGYNATYIALPGTTSTTLIGETTTGGGTCPAVVSVEGTVLGGTGGSITWPTFSATSPWASGHTGITTTVGQRFCAIVGEYGADSPFPGAQFTSVVDQAGNALPGSPALVPWLNQGVANFTGYTVAGAQDVSFTLTASVAGSVMTVTGSPGGTLAVGQTITGPSLPNGFKISSLGTGAGGAGTYNMSSSLAYAVVSATDTAHTYAPELTVTALKTYAITAASFNSTTGYATFTATNPGYIPGSEFTVSGMTSSGPGSFNLTYVAVAGTSGTTIVGNPLSGPVGVPQTSALTNSSAWTSGGTMASVIMPNQQVLGVTNGTVISPYGTFGSTGTGGVGTYGLTSTLATYTFTGSITGTTLTLGSTPAPVLVVGSSLVSSTGSGFTATRVTALLTGTGTSGSTYTVDVSQTAASGTITAANTIGTSGTPVTMFTFPQYYYSAVPSVTSTAPWGGTPTARSQATIADIVNMIGSTSAAAGGQGKKGWGGSLANASMLHGVFPQATGGSPDTTKLASLCKKTTDIQAFAAANSMTVRALYALNDPGMWGDSSAWMGQGYISGASGSTGTLNLSTTAHGAMTGSGTVVVSGPGIPGCPLTCPTAPLGAGPTYAITWGSAIAANVGSSGSPVAMSAGTYNPAVPIASNSFNGYIDAPGGVPTLHVTSIAASATSTFTGTLGNLISAGKIDNGAGASGKTLTVTTISNNPTIRYAQVGVGSLLTGPGITIPTRVDAVAPSINPDTGLALTGNGLTGTYHVDTAQLVTPNEAIFVSDILPGPANEMAVTGTGGATLTAGMIASDGGLNITDQPIYMSSANGTVGSLAIWSINQTYTPPFTNDASMVATFTTLVPGQYIAAAGITTPVDIISYGTGKGDVGTYILSNNANGSIGTSGSPIAMTSTSISDSGALTPGPALTINHMGAGVTFPTTSISCSGFGSCTGTGSVRLTGTYDTSVLGGTPSALQAQVSLTSGGPPVAGCSACAWTNLSGYSATLSSGTVYNWVGSAANIPATGAPLYVSVRAANGTAYATLSSFIKMGLVFEWQGEGQMGRIPSNQGGSVNSYFTGLWGINSLQGGNNDLYNVQGPALVSNYLPAQTQMFAGDRFSELQGGVPISEGSNDYAQLLTNAFGGWPVTVITNIRDGIGMTPETMGNVLQNHTIAVGDGTKTTWCSASKFCANVGTAGPLFYNGATQTGASVTGSISGNTLTTSAVGIPVGNSLAPAIMGALEPGMTLSDSTGNITGAPTLLNCLTGCIPTGAPLAYPAVETWNISGSAQTVASETIRADLGATPWPLYDIQNNSLIFSSGGYNTELVKAGTFQILVNGAVVCTDSSVFAYNVQGGNCVGGTISSAFVNYATGDYQVTFNTAPANGAIITATWTDIMSPGGNQTPITQRPQGFDFFGDGSTTSGPVSSIFGKTPGGINGHVNGGGISDQGILGGNYAIGATGYTQSLSWLYGTKFNIIPGHSASTPFISANYWRGEGPTYFQAGTGGAATQTTNTRFEQWASDIVTASSWTGTITSGVMTLATAATGPMWEGEAIAINGVASGDYILKLASGTWGASGSTYNIGNYATVVNTTGTSTLSNSVYYMGSGPTIYAGPLNDTVVDGTNLNGTSGYSPHVTNGFAGGRRVAARWAALVWGGLTNLANASDPTLDRVKANAVGCDAASIAAPCFDIGGTYSASHSATLVASSPTITVTGGISAGARPFVVGQALSCTSCTAGRFITAISVPPTMDSRGGQGEVGQTFTITANGNMGVSATETVTAGCSGTSGTGSNCIDIAIKINTTNGSYGTAAALATCGANNLNGNAPPYVTPNGVCVTNGVGSLVRNFRIGTVQDMWNLTTGTTQDDGLDSMNGSFSRNSAFTCNIVAAKVVQCVKGVAYSGTGASFAGAIGQWATGATFIEYGDPTVGTGRIASLQGFVGGQSFPINSPGSGQTPGTYTNVTGNTGFCALGSGGFVPKMDIVVGAGGTIIDAYPANTPSAMGLVVGGGCSFTPAGTGGSAGIVGPVTVFPLDGWGGIATYGSDSNMIGDMMYDNSGLPGNPLNPFFTNNFGGYYEPGLPVHPWGHYLGAAVSG